VADKTRLDAVDRRHAHIGRRPARVAAGLVFARLLQQRDVDGKPARRFGRSQRRREAGGALPDPHEMGGFCWHWARQMQVLCPASHNGLSMVEMMACSSSDCDFLHVRPGVGPGSLCHFLAADDTKDAVPDGRSRRLADMRSNPAGDWRIEDVVAVCREHGLRCSPPSSGGSHYKVSHPASRDILTIPSRRPVKPVYIRKLVRLIEAVTKTEDDR